MVYFKTMTSFFHCRYCVTIVFPCCHRGSIHCVMRDLPVPGQSYNSIGRAICRRVFSQLSGNSSVAGSPLWYRLCWPQGLSTEKSIPERHPFDQYRFNLPIPQNIPNQILWQTVRSLFSVLFHLQTKNGQIFVWMKCKTGCGYPVLFCIESNFINEFPPSLFPSFRSENDLQIILQKREGYKYKDIADFFRNDLSKEGKPRLFHWLFAGIIL